MLLCAGALLCRCAAPAGCDGRHPAACRQPRPYAAALPAAHPAEAAGRGTAGRWRPTSGGATETIAEPWQQGARCTWHLTGAAPVGCCALALVLALRPGLLQRGCLTLLCVRARCGIIIRKPRTWTECCKAAARGLRALLTSSSGLVAHHPIQTDMTPSSFFNPVTQPGLPLPAWTPSVTQV